jgi:hypothetical protein
VQASRLPRRTPPSPHRIKGGAAFDSRSTHLMRGTILLGVSLGQSGTWSLLATVSERNHKETWAGCIVSLTTPTRSSLNASRSVSSLSLTEKASNVFAASYFLR